MLQNKNVNWKKNPVKDLLLLVGAEHKKNWSYCAGYHLTPEQVIILISTINQKILDEWADAKET